MTLPVADLLRPTAHLYLWVPNALLAEGLAVMAAWGFIYKSNIVWHKVRKDGGSDGRGVGFYFRNVTELVLFGVRGKNARTLPPGRRQVNLIATQKREHSRKPDELYPIIEACSPGPFAELFARGGRPNWQSWGLQSEEYFPTWATYANHSRAQEKPLGSIKAKTDEKPILSPAMFIEKALRAATGQMLSASDAYAAYEAECAAQNAVAVARVGFWKTLSARAQRLGAYKTTMGGRIVYSNLKLAG
jgi:N6-adenosine-specific RNA methylase IME4